MRVKFSDAVVDALGDVPSAVQKAFFKQVKMLEQNLRHPSLRAKKYDEANDRWQARVNRGWRIYFKIEDDTYFVTELIPHPKK
jgi:mRNA-degrading endonuclease RelE of RelBE toxin-antitoxin system